jgi:hypothetical protein
VTYISSVIKGEPNKGVIKFKNDLTFDGLYIYEKNELYEIVVDSIGNQYEGQLSLVKGELRLRGRGQVRFVNGDYVEVNLESWPKYVYRSAKGDFVISMRECHEKYIHDCSIQNKTEKYDFEMVHLAAPQEGGLITFLNVPLISNPILQLGNSYARFEHNSKDCECHLKNFQPNGLGKRIYYKKWDAETRDYIVVSGEDTWQEGKLIRSTPPTTRSILQKLLGFLK